MNTRFEWNGQDGEGDTQASGEYSFRVTASDTEGNSINTVTYVSGEVDRVTYNQNGIFLWIGNTSINMGDVRSVSGAQTES